jgi:hypothetical protein
MLLLLVCHRNANETTRVALDSDFAQKGRGSTKETVLLKVRLKLGRPAVAEEDSRKRNSNAG